MTIWAQVSPQQKAVIQASSRDPSFLAISHHPPRLAVIARRRTFDSPLETISLCAIAQSVIFIGAACGYSRPSPSSASPARKVLRMPTCARPSTEPGEDLSMPIWAAASSSNGSLDTEKVKSGGFRSIVLFRKEDSAFFVFGFAKRDRDNIGKDELKAFRNRRSNARDERWADKSGAQERDDHRGKVR